MSEALEGDISMEFYAILEHLQIVEFLCFVVVFSVMKTSALYLVL